jgi:hypothetical protein
MTAIFLIVKESTTPNGATFTEPYGYTQKSVEAKEFCKTKNSEDTATGWMYSWSYQIIEEIYND